MGDPERSQNSIVGGRRNGNCVCYLDDQGLYPQCSGSLTANVAEPDINASRRLVARQLVSVGSPVERLDSGRQVLKIVALEVRKLVETHFVYQLEFFGMWWSPFGGPPEEISCLPTLSTPNIRVLTVHRQS